MHVLVTTIVHVPLDARILHRQIRAMLDAGWQVTYAAPWGATRQSVPAWADPDRLRTLDLPRATGRARREAVGRARRLIATLEREADLVLVHDLDLLAAVAGRRRAAPVVWDVHEDTAGALADRAWVPGWAEGPLRIAVRAVERWAERRLHLVIAEADYQRRFVRTHPVIPNHPWVPREVDEPGADRVVYVGRISSGRGAHELVDLGRRLAPSIRVELIGAPDDDVRHLIEDAAGRGEVEWRGFLPNDEALARVEGALAGLSLLHDDPNYRVSTPTKLLEYLAHGVPVVTTPLPLAARLVEDERCGIVVGFGDVDAAEAAIRRLAGDAGIRRRLAAAGRRAVRERYNWQRTSERFLDVLRGWVPRR